ncbi:MAG: hypothetical protein EB082_19070 [Verrucomicrobia bacterium]|nr:hypothetical protein [Verrucomicrobiota bacterium]
MCELLRVRWIESDGAPDLRGFARPDAGERVVATHRADAFPQQVPQGIRHGKIRVGFAVQQRLLLHQLQGDCANDPALGVAGDLKFLQPLFQRGRIEPLGFPKRPQRRQIIQRGAAGVELWFRHAARA